VATYPNIPIYANPNMIQSVEDGTGKYWVQLMQKLTKKELKKHNNHVTYPSSERW
jgi:hypothetical protein